MPKKIDHNLKKITKEELKKIEDMKNTGISWTEVSKKLGFKSRVSIFSWFRKNKIKVKRFVKLVRER